MSPSAGTRFPITVPDRNTTFFRHPPFFCRRLVAGMRLNLLLTRKRAAIVGGTAAAIVLASVGAVTAADPFGWWATQPHPFQVNDDHGVAGPGGTVTGNLLANDFGATAVVRNGALDDPAAGTLTVNADGSYGFTPAVPGSHGTVHFTYTATDAVTLYKDAVPGGGKIPPLGQIEGPNGSTVLISGGGYGSSFVP